MYLLLNSTSNYTLFVRVQKVWRDTTETQVHFAFYVVALKMFNVHNATLPVNNSSINTTNTSLIDGNCSQLTMQYVVRFNSLPMILSISIAAAQLYNLVVFLYWRNKEPFLLLHVWLTITSLFYGVNSFMIPLTRILSWHEIRSVIAIRLFMASYFVVQAVSALTLLAVSVDRWLSVEFAIKYRNEITKEKVKRVVKCTVIVGLLIR